MIDSNKLSEYIKQVDDYITYRFTNGYNEVIFYDICSGIYTVLYDWTGNNYVGDRKLNSINLEYQRFFKILSKLLNYIENNTSCLSEKEISLAELMIYRGVIYRYLGKNDVRNHIRREKVIPEYNNDFVSWSKNKEIPYTIVQKLYGPITKLTAIIDAPNFGIDIAGFEKWCEKWLGECYSITRGGEQEVVFPTNKTDITEIEYLKIDDD